MISRILLVSVFGVLAAACGGKTDNITDGGPDDANNGDGGPGPGPGPGPDCPTSPPSSGGACTKANIQCEYGSDPRWTCNTVAMCTGGVWSYQGEDHQSCPTASAPECPQTLGEVQVGASCTPSDISCNYSTSSATQFCVCSYMGGPVQIDGGNNAKWQCGNYQPTGCPATRPELGSSCTQPNVQCDYGVCGVPNGLGVQCSPVTNTWVEGMGSVCAGAN